jgi:hypothetical protein
VRAARRGVRGIVGAYAPAQSWQERRREVEFPGSSEVVAELPEIADHWSREAHCFEAGDASGVWDRQESGGCSRGQRLHGSLASPAGRSMHARGCCSRSVLRRPGELLDKKIGEDFDPLRSRSSGRRYPVGSSRWERPIRQQSLQPTGGECLAQNEFGQDAEAGSGNQGRHHGVTIIHAQRTRRPHRCGFAVFGKAPRLGRRRIAVADAAVLREMKGMLRSAMLVQVYGRADQSVTPSQRARTLAETAGRGVSPLAWFSWLSWSRAFIDVAQRSARPEDQSAQRPSRGAARIALPSNDIRPGRSCPRCNLSRSSLAARR